MAYVTTCNAQLEAKKKRIEHTDTLFLTPRSSISLHAHWKIHLNKIVNFQAENKADN